MQAEWKKYILNFITPGGTSRGVMTTKTSYFIKITDGKKVGIGECGLLQGLSFDDRPGYEEYLDKICDNPELELSDLNRWPSIRAGLEMAKLDLQNGNHGFFYDSEFRRGKTGLPINGLVWMGDKDEMKTSVIEKINSGFTCIKIKIGAIDFDDEIGLLKMIREEFMRPDLEIRLDANGAFSLDNVHEKLSRLAEYDIHSIEQPIKPRQAMELVCEKSPIPVVLDEELIGVTDPAEQALLLDRIKPHYIILKPSLVGGFKASEDWIQLATHRNIGWWVTSALESNIGLNAISQWTATLGNSLPQGLGTGGLFSNNFESPLSIVDGKLFFNPQKSIDFSPFE